MADRSIKVTLRANVADFKAQIRQASSSLEDLVKSADKTATVADTHFGRMAQSMQFQRDSWEQAGSTMTAFGVATTAALAGTAKAAIDWESAFAGVKKTVDATPQQLSALNDGLRQMARELPASHAEIAAVAEAAGQLGIETPNILAFTETMIGMGSATSLSAEEAATTLARFANIMGTSQSEFSNMGSSLVALGNNFATTETEIADMALRLASAGSQAGMSEGDVLGLATALSSVGIEAEAGGTAFSKVIIDMRGAVDSASPKLETFAKVAGMSASEFQKLFNENSGEAITRFVAGLGEMEKAGQNTQPILQELGMTDVRVGNALRSSASSAEMFTEAMQMGNAAYSENSALAQEVEARNKTIAAQLDILKNTFLEAAISLGEAFLPILKEAIPHITEFAAWIADLPEPVRAIIGGMGALAGSVTLAGGAFLLLTPRVVDTVNAFKTLKNANIIGSLTSLPGPVGKLSGKMQTASKHAVSLGKALKPSAIWTAVGVGVLQLTDAFIGLNNEIVNTENLAQRILNWDTGEIYSKMFAGFDDAALNKYSDLGVVFDSLANVSFSDKVEDLLNVDATGFNDVKTAVEQLDQALSAMSTADAAAQLRKLWQEAGGTQKAFDDMLGSMPDVKQNLLTAAEAAGFAADETGLFEFVTSGAATSADGMADSANGMADSLSAVEGEAGEATATLEDYISALAEAAGINMSADEAAMAYADTLAQVTSELVAGAGASATGTQAQRENLSSLIDLSKAGWDEVQSLTAQGASADTVAGKMQSLAGDFVTTAQKMGMTGDEAVRLAGDYGLIPKNIKTKADFDDWVAREGVNGFKAHLNGIPAYKEVMLVQRIVQKGRLLNVGNINTTGFVGSTYSRGGYTGPGGVYEPAGIVHKGEVVWSQKDVARAGGVAAVEALRLGLRGYAAGGYVSGRSSQPIHVASPSLEGLAIQGSLNMDGVLVPLIDGRIAKNPAVSAVSGFVSNSARYRAVNGVR